ncbi:MAG: hypothetical protein NC548_59090 [Lachnospiraceae bacterium]|nr:hypothetical protein [Lachnospiraceae bacterium]
MMWLKRYRHSRGFGVHSPFAYRLITECLRERLPYYAYAGFTGLEQCLAFRLAVFFQPRRIRGMGKEAERLVKAARKGCPKAIPADAPAVAAFGGVCEDLLIIGPSFSLEPGWAPPMSAAVLVVANPGAVEAMRKSMAALGFGMSFIDGPTALFATFSALPRQSFFPRLA